MNIIEYEIIITNENYIVRDHRVHGIRILPGITFLDMIYRLISEDFDTKHIALKNILFKEPIATTDDFDKKILIRLEINSDQIWSIAIKSQKIKNGISIESSWSDNMECELHTDQAINISTINISDLKKSAQDIFDMDNVYALARQVFIEHKIFMKALGKVYQGKDYVLLELTLSDIAKKYLNKFYIHPAFLDASTLSLYALCLNKNMQLPYIPFFIRSFQAFSVFPETCYVYIPLSDQFKLQDTISTDIQIFDPQGRLLVYFEHLVAKCIRSKELMTKLINNKQSTEIKSEPVQVPSTKYQVPEVALGEVIEQDIKRRIAEILKQPPEEISLTAGFYEQGLDSTHLLKLVRDLEKKLGIKLYPTLLFEYDTINKLTAHLFKEYGSHYKKDLHDFKHVSISHETPEVIVKNTSAVLAAQLKSQPSTDNAIAIIGVSGRYPQSDNLEQFWENLKSGRDCITEIPLERWDYHINFDPNKEKTGQSYAKWGGFINDYDKFDPLFFNISPREAEVMDPQERLFLEVAWATLEDAGYTPEQLGHDSKSLGVFVGVMFGYYQFCGAEETVKGYPTVTDSTYSSIANRVSYYLNLNGPSLAVDTMCSSSLIAIHLACQSILRGECELALAGGVNIISHPQKYLLLSQKKFLSSDGKCRSFGADGDGYVPGEGIGAVLLKRLNDAIKDSDKIYGVIRGSSLNHSGHTSGFYVPNSQAQAELIQTVLQQERIDPETINYIETHGTGTSLGDPIEIAGLNKAFGTKRVNPCAIGSVKSNIGHCESAAGISAITKVLLQLQHKILVPSIHSEVLNPNINWAETPFKVQHELGEWKKLILNENGIQKELPRRAGINSFGAGGTNAHIIIEEAPEQILSTKQTKPAYLITLSAKQPSSLQQRITDLSTWVKAHPTMPIEAIAYTLNARRSHFNYRCALIVSNTEELKTMLMQIQEGNKITGYFQGEALNKAIKSESDTQESKKILEELQSEESKKSDVYKRNLTVLANLYVQGGHIDWQKLHEGEALQKISLPTYPFLKQRYWITVHEDNKTKTEFVEKLHPLVGRNVSTFEKMCFETEISADAFYLTDHQVHGQKVFPGAAYLEMVRAAGELAAGREVKQIRNIFWLRPLIINNRQEITTLLYPQTDGSVIYEITTGEGNAQIIHSKGELLYDLPESSFSKWQTLENLQTLPTTLSKQMIYERFLALGLQYGASFQPLEWMKIRDQEALVYYKLPSGLKEEKNFILHPSLLDGAFQSIIGLILNPEQSLLLPFSLDELNIKNSLPTSGYVYVRFSSSNETNFFKYDLQVWDESGHICAELNGFNCQTVRAENPKPISSFKSTTDDMSAISTAQLNYYKPNWITKNLPNIPEDKNQIKSLCVLSENKELITAVRQQLSGIPVIWIKIGNAYEQLDTETYQVRVGDRHDHELLLNAIQQGGVQFSHLLFAQGFSKADGDLSYYVEQGLGEAVVLVQALIRHNISSPLQLLVIYPYATSALSPQAMFTGFAKTLKQEKPQYNMRVAGMDKGLALSALASQLIRELLAPNESDAHIRYRYMGSVRQVERYEEMELDKNKVTIALRKMGIYLITGGLGGLGLIFARYLAKTYQAKLILTGRSALDVSKQQALNDLQELGGDVLYLTGDVSQFDDVQRWIAEGKAKFGSLHGIIHSAGVLHDGLLINKNWDEFKKILAPKIKGSIHLDAATATEPLECFVLFSSIASCLGNIGQSDYASGNAFMDEFARWREAQVKQNKRHGQTVSINWPLWKEGGMQVDQATEQYLEETLGMKSLPTSLGVEAFSTMLAQLQTQCIVLYGLPNQIKNLITGTDETKKTEIEESTTNTTEIKSGIEVEKTIVIAALISDLQKIVGGVIKLAPNMVNKEEALTNYGYDSVSFTDLSQQLKRELRLTVAPTIYFERPTLKQIAEYIWDNHSSTLLQHYQASLKSKIAPPPVLPKIRPTAEKKRETATAVRNSSTEIKQHDIAIIGVAGIFPESSDVEDFWAHLQRGDDMISEIPPERWNWQEYQVPKWGGFIHGIDEFDPQFFNISPHEAQLMDPQQRLFLQASWKAIEDAGYSIESFAKAKTGLFVGVATSDYMELLQKTGAIEAYTSTGTAHSVLANRVSYLLNLRGPSEAVDTACSSSLIALHLAVKAIQNGECEVALAGGVNALLTPTLYITFSQAGMLSPDGRCKTFDQSANGYVRGEGVGVIILKSLEQALKDRDTIYGVIKSSSVNHGGRVTTLTAPNPNAQAELIIDAYQRANIKPNSVSYIEAHGTGTPLGDPIEINGLKKAFQDLTSKEGLETLKEHSCAIGSVKANIGHLEGAAGIAGVIKILMMLKNKMMPPQIHIQKLNSYIELSNSPFYIAKEAQAWSSEGKRRAGVSSFGFGGANAHVVIEEAPAMHASAHQSVRPAYLIAISAKTESALQQKIIELETWLNKQKREITIEDISYTLNAGRDHFNYRCALVVNSVKELQEKLNQVQKDHKISGYFRGFIDKEIDDSEIYRRVLKTTLDELKIQDKQDANDYKKKLSALANLYVKGYDIDWDVLYDRDNINRINLPTYPFAKQHYWISRNKETTSVEIKGLHPLIDSNISTLKKECFKKIFTGHEFYLTDHRISNNPILPGVAYLEMAIAAGRIADPERKIIGLSNVIWGSPIRITNQEQIATISLYSVDDGVDYEISTLQPNKDSQKEFMLHAQGKIIYAENSSINSPVKVNITEIKKRCADKQTKDGMYSELKIRGLEIGPNLQVIQWNLSNKKETISYLQLPDNLRNTVDQFILHPSLMDGSVQTGLELLKRIDNEGLYLPFSIGKLEIYGPLPQSCYAYVTVISQTENMPMFDIRLIDENGHILVHMKDFAVRALYAKEQKKSTVHNTSKPESSMIENKQSDIFETVKNQVVMMIANLLAIDAQTIKEEEDISRYGMDSIGFIKFTNTINNYYKLQLTPAVMFDHKTLKSLIQYLITNHYNALKAIHGEIVISTVQIDPAIPSQDITMSADSRESRTHQVALAASPSKKPYQDGIAIIGVSGIFPGSFDVEDFWTHLHRGDDMITEIPIKRWDWKNYTASKWGGFIHGIDEFDPQFFSISPREAQLMDPQQRLFLETTWRAMEDAGYSAKAFAKIKTGLFVGVASLDYLELLQNHGAIEAYTPTGTAHSILANRVSYLLNLTGPSEAIDTACSSSLVAIHHAVKAIQDGECEVAIAGGVNALLTPTLSIAFTKAGMLSPDGRCKTFDDSANGYVRGEGVGAIILKPLHQAIKDQDKIYGVIKSSSVNHGGHVTSLTAPNPTAQAEVIIDAFQRANIKPETVSYIEAHGTGTSLGDPVEINGLKKAFQTLASQKLAVHSCAVGSVKANIGHLEGAAGIAGVIKVLMMLKYQMIPPQINFHKLNSYIELDQSPFYIPQKAQKWKSQGKRRAGISSFGFGGANAHIVIEEAPKIEITSPQASKPAYMMTLSAKTETALQQKLIDLKIWLDNQKTINLEDISYTLNMGRDHFNYRCALVISSIDELREKLKQIQTEQKVSGYFRGHVGKEPDDAAIYKRVLKITCEELKAQSNQDAEDYKEKLAALANLYVKGYDIDLTILYQGKMHHKVNLPAYPFAKERYWVEKNKSITESRPLLNTANAATHVNYYQPIWEEIPFSIQDGKHFSHDPIILFTENNNFAQAMREKIPGQIIIRIKAGEKFQKISEYECQLNLTLANNYTSLIDFLNKQGILPKTIIYHTEILPQSIQLIAEQQFYTLFFISQALLQKKFNTEIRLVTLNEIVDQDAHFTQAATAFSKTAHAEYPKLIYQVINTRHLDELGIKNILQEINSNELTVFHDENHVRFVKHYQRMHIQDILAPQLKSSGVYLITGGMGGLGLLFARYLAEHYQAKLVLIGRSTLKDKQKTILKELEELGSHAIYIKADVTKQNDLENVLKKTKSAFGSLNGIIHAAGIVKPGLIIKKDVSEVATVIAPKVLGAIYLDTVTQTEPLDFYVLFSSMTSIFGEKGLIDYAYANGFMDDFAEWREALVKQNKRHGKTISINWPMWEEGGLQVHPANQERLKQTLGVASLKSSDGIKAFNAALAQTNSQFIVLSGDDKKLEKNISNINLSTQAMMRSDQSTHKNSDELIKQLEKEIQALIAESLSIKKENLDVEASLMDHGLDSIMMIEVLSKVERNYHKTIDAGALIEHQTIRSFTNYLISNGIGPLAEELQTASSTSVAQPQQIQENYSSNKIKPTTSKIAIIGMACRFPQSPHLEAYWDNLQEGRELITEIPTSRWSISEYYSPDKTQPNKTYSKWGGFVENIEMFDANFFSILGEDAILMDPPQRLILELTQEVLDRSGYSRNELSGHNVGVFIGGGTSDYYLLYMQHVKNEWRKHMIADMDQNMLAARISDFYNFKGPSLTIDSACSSSIVAIHQACQSLLTGESEFVIAGGAEIVIGPEAYIDFSKSNALSDDGKCYVFDERAKGLVLSEGLGLVLLKNYEQAIEDQDNIIGVILSSAINNDGHTPGITVPNPEGQRAVIQAALTKSGITPDSISYYEAHGTGTLLGDPIEIKAMTELYSRYTNQKGYCAVGSVKSNMGHTLRASGIASIIKVLLSMQHKLIPPTLNCENPHPRFHFSDSPFYPVTQLTPWNELHGVRRAAISSFGFGGTNAHIILEEYTGTEGTRKPLPITQFQRQRYWLGDKTPQLMPSIDYNFYKNILENLESGKFDVKQAIDLSNQKDK